MSEEQVRETLAATVALFTERHHNILATFEENSALVAHRVPGRADLSRERRLLIGAYCTQEYSVESAALFNPSMVPHPDQTGLEAGELRLS